MQEGDLIKLSMWILNRALKEAGYTTFPFIYQGDLVIESVRVLSDGDDCTASLENVYVGRAADFFSGTEVGQLLLVSGADIIFVEQGELCQVLNQVIHIFDLYRAWSERLIQASFDPSDPFQRMLDVIHEEFHCPMFFGKKDMEILAITDQYTDEDTYDGWNDIVAHRTFPVYMFSRPRPERMDNYPEELPIVAIPAEGYTAWHYDYQIRCNCYCGGKLWGHLYVLYNQGKRIDQAILQLVRYCGNIYGDLLDRNAAQDKSYWYERFLLLCRAINGEHILGPQMDNIYMQMQWRQDQPLVLYLLSFATAYGLEPDALCSYIYETLEKHVTNELIFPYQSQLLILAPVSSDGIQNLLRYIQLNLVQKNYVCGVSYPFQDLNALRFAYFQARYAISRFIQAPPESESRMAPYTDWAFSGLLQYVKDNIAWKSFIAPELVQLYKMDQEAGTEYYQTLFCFLMNNGRVDSTASQLFIHRNTLKYRMDKILQVVKLDLSDTDVTTYLKICYSLMWEDYPSELPKPRPE